MKPQSASGPLIIISLSEYENQNIALNIACLINEDNKEKLMAKLGTLISKLSLKTTVACLQLATYCTILVYSQNPS